MITESDTRVIDPEFAFFGPMGFDIGAVLGNLLMNFFAQDGHASPESPRADYQDWVLATTEAVWDGFRQTFLALWRDQASGDAYPSQLFSDTAGKTGLESERKAYLDRFVRRLDRLCGGQDDQENSRPRPQYRFRVDQQPGTAGLVRDPLAPACPRHDGPQRSVSRHRQRHRSGAADKR
jgi:hypothetical protein